MDFPDNALTNFYVLHDFTDIAYAVCVLTNLAGDGAKGSISPSLSQTQCPSTARLQKAEQEIRRIGILVSSDPVKQELFTFFRKADIQRDGKSIFSRLVAVLRSNVCTISEKNAVKASDMLRPDNSKLHRLFISALTPSIRSIIVSIKGLLPCGMASFITQSQGGETPETWCVEPSEEKSFKLLDMNTQLVASGHLLLSFRQRKSVHLSQPTVKNHNSKIKSPTLNEGLNEKPDSVIVLAPSGRLARSVCGQASTVAQPQGLQLPNTENDGIPGLLHVESTKREIWETMVKDWLTNQKIELAPSDQEMWVDVELPIRTVAHSPVPSGSPTATHSEPLIMWRSFRWPTALCFELQEMQPLTAAITAEENGMEDPLSFAEDWFLGAEARAKILEERRLSRLAMKELGNQQTEAEAIPQNPLFASSPTFHRHAVGELSVSNNIYPTPPDGPVSQVTPGMSSMDGVVATPADQSQPLPDPSHKHDDEEMEDAADAEDDTLAIGTGQYDEDLFGDIPVETFGPAGIADEPNWDFFDEPELEMVTDDVERAEPDDLQHGESLNIDESDIPLSFSGDQDMSSRSPMVEDREEAEQEGHKMEDANAESPRNLGPDSPASKEQLSHDKEDKMDLLESTISEQPPRPRTALEIKRAVADSRHFFRQFPDDAGDRISSSEHELGVDRIVDVVHTESGVQLSDDKYGANGRFWFGSEDANAGQAPRPNFSIQIPRIGLRPFDSSSEMARQKSDELNDKMVLDVAESEWISSAEESDFDSSDFFSNGNELGTPSADASREWTKYAAASPDHPKTHGDPLDEQEVRHEFDQLLEHLRIDDLHAHPPDYERQKPELVIASTKGTNDIMIAQILVDQLSQSSLQHTMFSMPEAEDVPLLDYDISKELGEVYGMVEQVNVHQFAHLSCADNDDTERVSKLNDTSIRIYREGKPLTALSTILPFWDALGLQPAGGRKNITALCIHPHGSNVTNGCRTFMERLGETYENCNLGNHKIGKIDGTTDSGLVAWSNNDVSLPDLPQTCERVGTALARLPDTDDNIVIYMVVPNESDAQILKVCECFMALLPAYVKTCGKKQPNELVLQLIPVSFVALPDTLAIPTQNEYFTLALEVYNRCPPADAADKTACLGSAVVLAERARKRLDFDLATTVQSPFEKSGRALHLAYSESTDNRWITAAWTDKLGNTALTMSYCLRQRGSRIARPVAEVIKDLWDISVDLMQKSRTKWRLMVAKAGRLTVAEVNDWALLANPGGAATQVAQHVLVLLSVNPEPSLSLRLSPATTQHVPSGATQQPSGLYGTPVSTPQPSSTSPDQTTIATPTPGGTALNAPTPPDHSFDPNAETDLSLSDPVEATWSVILSHGISQGDSILEARPALASGYLLKRRGTSDADTVVALEVNIVHAALPAPSERQDLLKEILSQYKDLVTLARTRGVIDPVSCVLPWHIATAMKGQQALSLIM